MAIATKWVFLLQSRDIVIIISHLVSFVHQLTLVVFHMILSDSKSTQISKILLRIRADHNNSVVRMFLILLLLSNSFSLFNEHFRTIPSAPAITGITVTLTFNSCFFLFIWQGPSLSFRFLSILHWSPSERKNPRDDKFFSSSMLHLVFWPE